jgi:hypothetical protein
MEIIFMLRHPQQKNLPEYVYFVSHRNDDNTYEYPVCCQAGN